MNYPTIIPDLTGFDDAKFVNIVCELLSHASVSAKLSLHQSRLSRVVFATNRTTCALKSVEFLRSRLSVNYPSCGVTAGE